MMIWTPLPISLNRNPLAKAFLDQVKLESSSVDGCLAKYSVHDSQFVCLDRPGQVFFTFLTCIFRALNSLRFVDPLGQEDLHV